MKSKHINRGYTLMELLIVVAVIGALAAIAAGNFGRNVSSARRTDGQETLLNVAARLEKCKTVYGSYNNANCSISDGDSIDSPDAYYSIRVTATATTFTLTASPQGAQTSDDCTSMTLNQLLQQGGSPNADTCW